MMRSTYLIAILMMSGLSGWGQEQASTPSHDSTRTLSFYGSIDTYFHRSFNTVEQAPRTSFSNLPGFSLGMVNLALDYSTTRSGMVADIVLGPRGVDALFNAPSYKNAAGAGSSHLINQMFVYYVVADRLRLNAGQFNTFFGYESISPTKNPQYSTSYLFSYGPFNHTGFWADVHLGNHWFGKLAVMNPTDYTEFNPFESFTVGGQLAYKTDCSFFNLNASWGDPDGRLQQTDSVGTSSAGNALQLDLSTSFPISDRFSFGLSTAMRSIGKGQRKTTASDHMILEASGYYGVTMYQTIRFSPAASLGIRSEYFLEHNGGVDAIGAYNNSGKASVISLTVSGDFHVGSLKVIPEVRQDRTSTRAFTRTSDGGKMNSMITVNLAIIYTLPVISRKI